jgi:hypothetical protein
MTIQFRRVYFVLAVAACTPSPKESARAGDEASEPTEAASPITHVQLIDSVLTGFVWNPMDDSTWTYGYTVTTTSGVDTLRMIIDPRPIIVGDTSVLGLVLVPDSGDDRRELFRYTKGRPTHRWRLPEDVHWVFHDVVPSPDGRFIAYVAQDSSYSSFALVRDLSNGQIIIRGVGRGGCDCDVDRNHARWVQPDSFEIAVALANSAGGWELVSGRAGQRRFHTDTITTEPKWH